MKNLNIIIILALLKFIVFSFVFFIAIYFIVDSISDFRIFLFPYIFLSVLYIVIAYKRDLPGSVKANKNGLYFTEKDIQSKLRKRKVSFNWADIEKVSLRVKEEEFPDEWFGLILGRDWIFHLNNGSIIEIDNSYITWYARNKISKYLIGFNVKSASLFIKSKTEGEQIFWCK